VDQLGSNALGEVLEPGRVTDCYFGLLSPQDPSVNLRPGPSWSSPQPSCCILEFPSRPAA
jgi:hypothetical protein